ncbi:MAG: OmpA family protein [Desulfobulbaceae bacterium]|uniref:Peptidoglycan-associated lipoprotein n=1 Tax=Candidatus Desulfatifera sulfidica TaxID=2841691 RepID=A0A8J6N6U5_9BACT|nr:OmpA family protein [Candidatus Desulfatifera sulfidica]
MNRKQILSVLLAGSLFIALSGCGKKPIMPLDGGAAGSASADQSITGYSEDNLPREGSLDDTTTSSLSINQGDTQSDEYKRQYGRSSIQLKPIYFSFDQAAIRSDMVDNLIHNANVLKNMPNATLLIEGNCDERGTNEYNLALGERRAINAKEYLINLGVAPYRIRTVSYGEERPLFTGMEENNLSHNRRDDFIIE